MAARGGCGGGCRGARGPISRGFGTSPHSFPQPTTTRNAQTNRRARARPTLRAGPSMQTGFLCFWGYAGPLAPASRPLRGRVAAAKRAQNGPAAGPQRRPTPGRAAIPRRCGVGQTRKRVCSEEEMQTRVGDAMRGLERLQGMSIDPGELPTVRALYIRWSIAQWALQGPAHTSRRHATPQRLEAGRDGEGQRQATDAGDMESNGGQIATSRISVASEAYFGHNLRDARKRVRGDGVSCVVEDTPLGQIRGPGCRFVKAQRCSRYSSF